MRLGWLTLLLLVTDPVAVMAAGDGALVATRVVEPAPYDLTLPEKVGLLEAERHRTLSFEVAGRIAGVADEGARVAAGEVIAELDNALERAELRQAELRLRLARSELRRVRGLQASNAASVKALESAETALALRVAERDAAREGLDRRTLLAPFDGVVAETRFDPREVVSPAAALVLFMDLSALRLKVGVPGYQITRVHEGQAVFVTSPGLTGVTFEGVVDRVAVAAPEGRHLFEVEIRIANPDERLRPGMSAHARIVTHSFADALALPLEAAVERDGAPVVFFVDGGQARAVSVADAILHGEHLVLAPAPAHRELIVRGQRELRDGMIVRVDNTVLEGIAQGAAR